MKKVVGLTLAISVLVITIFSFMCSVTFASPSQAYIRESEPILLYPYYCVGAPTTLVIDSSNVLISWHHNNSLGHDVALTKLNLDTHEKSCMTWITNTSAWCEHPSLMKIGDRFFVTYNVGETNGEWTVKCGASEDLNVWEDMGHLLPRLILRIGVMSEFNGISDYMMFPHSPDLGLTSGMILDFWFKLNRVDYCQYIFNKQRGATGWGVRVDTDNRIRLLLNGVSTDIKSRSTLTTDRWYHIRVTWDGETVAKIYINDKLDAEYTQLSGELLVNEQSLIIGADDVLCDHWLDGALDEVRIYDGLERYIAKDTKYRAMPFIYKYRGDEYWFTYVSNGDTLRCVPYNVKSGFGEDFEVYKSPVKGYGALMWPFIINNGSHHLLYYYVPYGIRLASSEDGTNWTFMGTILNTPHVNPENTNCWETRPSVVKHADHLYLFVFNIDPEVGQKGVFIYRSSLSNPASLEYVGTVATDSWYAPYAVSVDNTRVLLVYPAWPWTEGYVLKARILTWANIVQITNPTTSSPIYMRAGTTLTVNYTYTDLNTKNATIKVYNATHTVGETLITDLFSGEDVTRSDSFNIATWVTDGLYNVSVTICNLAEQTGTDTQADSVVIDNTPPVINVTYPSNYLSAESYLKISTIWVNGTVKETNMGVLEPSINDTRFSLYYWSSVTGAFAFKNNTDIPDGSIFVMVSFTDLAGNIGSDVAAFTLDTVPPVVEILYPEKATISVKTVWINGTITELNIEGLTPTINDTRFDRTHWNPATGHFAFLNNTVISDGQISLTVSVTDLAGLSGSDTVSFILDATAPIVVITYPKDEAYLSVSTIWINGTITELNIDGQLPAVNNTDFSLISWNSLTGEFAFQNSTIISEGLLSVVVSFIDSAGNIGSDSVSFHVGHLMPEIVLREQMNMAKPNLSAVNGTSLNLDYFVCISTMSPSSRGKDNPTFWGLNGKRLDQTLE